VEDCDLHFMGFGTVGIEGNNFVFKKNEVGGSREGSLTISGEDALVERNNFSRIEGLAVVTIFGDGAEVVRNKTDGGTKGIDIEGHDAFVAKNKIRNTGRGLQLRGRNPVVEKNEILDASDVAAIDVACEENCREMRIRKNSVERTSGAAQGIVVIGEDGGGEIRKNQVEGTDSAAFNLQVSEAVISDNEAKGIGALFDDCFYVEGDQNRIEENTAKDCGGTGFFVRGMDTVVEDNRASRVGGDGFTVDLGSLRMRLEDNRVKDATLSGFHVRDEATVPARDTVLEDNRSSKSRFDLCDEGDGTSLLSNRFDRIHPAAFDGSEECPTY